MANIEEIEDDGAILIAEEKVNIAEEKLIKAKENYKILSLKAKMFMADYDMSSDRPLVRVRAGVDKAEAEMLLAEIEMREAKKELYKYYPVELDYRSVQIL